MRDRWGPSGTTTAVGRESREPGEFPIIYFPILSKWVFSAGRATKKSTHGSGIGCRHDQACWSGRSPGQPRRRKKWEIKLTNFSRENCFSKVRMGGNMGTDQDETCRRPFSGGKKNEQACARTKVRQPVSGIPDGTTRKEEAPEPRMVCWTHESVAAVGLPATYEHMSSRALLAQSQIHGSRTRLFISARAWVFKLTHREIMGTASCSLHLTVTRVPKGEKRKVPKETI